LIDWEIFNRPNKNSVNGFSHFAIRAETGGQVIDTRILHGDLAAPYSGTSDAEFIGFGHGISRPSLTGVPHFREAAFEGAYPFATVHFSEEKFPGAVSLSAFNPFIPLNDVDSSLPAAFFSIEVHNTTDQSVRYTICAVLRNPLPADTLTSALVEDNRTLLKLASAHLASDDIRYGDMTLATDADDVSYQQYWFRGSWFDNLQVYWRDLTAPGRLKNRVYESPLHRADRGFGDHCSLAGHVDLAPGELGHVRFVISWNFPNVTNYWNPLPPDTDEARSLPATWKNYYATLFEDSTRSATYALQHWDRLYQETRRFADALFSSTLPTPVLDAVSANISILKSATVLRLEDGSFYGFEGCHSTAGSCEGSCTHVWNYAYALPFLFPALERSMRDLDYRYNMRFDGKMGFRLQLPLGRPFSDYHPAADGQFGGVVKAYRDWKISGDDLWLRSNWPAIKKSIAFAWCSTNEDKWDLDKDGVLEGRQHHTLDTELFGPNAYLTGFYLAALKAGAEIASYFGEDETAHEYAALFERGRTWVERHLFNGEYYYQAVDVTDRTILAPYRGSVDKYGPVEEYYWDAEHGEIKYQIAGGCHIDQVIAQWHANICGLGEIFHREHVRSALRAIYRHNFKHSMRDFFNPCRVYAVNDEAALVICDWPEGTPRPAVPLPYAEEAQNGYEYQAATHMIQEGLIDEGLAVVSAIRDRYDGEKRNPWNEFECGSNYARSMASYALLAALSGFEFDMTKGHMGFAPALSVDPFRCFWSLDCAWGVYEREGDMIRLHVESGTLCLRSYADSLFASGGRVQIRAKDALRFQQEGACLRFAAPLQVTREERLEIVVERAAGS
jgi:uncharacterized protein (DUF608 family)